ncbi:MAG: WhiB family transcriptional regulator [bacterium]|nr:WhiB family transcriptional regulator [bacterium]MCY4258470.1 WhiB family transcriptional regulator [bacterium]
MFEFNQADTQWRKVAACRDSDPSLFFPVGRTGMAVEQVKAAKIVCAECVAQADCLAFALNTNQDSGVWGGTSEDERRQMRRMNAHNKLQTIQPQMELL